MSEIVDLVLPILQKMQADIAEVKRVQADHTRILTEQSEKLDELEIHLAYLTGRESQNSFDMTKLRQRLRAAEERLAELSPS